MKIKLYLLVILVLVIAVAGCKSPEVKDGEKISTEAINNPVTASGDNKMGNLPQFKFVAEEHDFGAIIEGEKVSYTFKFKNIGGSDLVISSAKGSCGCTVPKWNKEPVAPGKEGEIEVIFDSSGKSGNQSKTINVTANTQPNSKILTITCEVITPTGDKNK